MNPAIQLLKEEIAAKRRLLKWLLKNQAVLANLPEVSLCNTKVDFDQLSHADVIRVVQALPGKWSKTLSTVSGRIDYTAQIDGMTIRCWAGEPPAACKIVEETVVVPAQPATTVTVRRLVCPEGVAA